MKRNRLSNSALEVTEFCLGTMTWGELEEPARWFDSVLSAEVLAGLETVNAVYPSPAAQ